MQHSILFIFTLILLCSCNNKKATEKPISDKVLFAEALERRDSEKINYYKEHIRMTENMQNIIKLNVSLGFESLIKLNNQISYINQFTDQMNDMHKFMLYEITKWVYLRQIYQHEVSPPVRILQRGELYLTPSNLDFNLCPSNKEVCASEIRDKISLLMSNDEVKMNLKNMASKDPCVNLSQQLKGQSYANSCLRKNKGQLKVELLSLPFINKKLWLQALSLE